MPSSLTRRKAALALPPIAVACAARAPIYVRGRQGPSCACFPGTPPSVPVPVPNTPPPPSLFLFFLDPTPLLPRLPLLTGGPPVRCGSAGNSAASPGRLFSASSRGPAATGSPASAGRAATARP